MEVVIHFSALKYIHLILTSIVLLTSFELIADEAQQAKHLTRWPVIERCYTLSYDSRTKNAYWIYERLTTENLKGNEDRYKCHFKEDLSIPEIFRSSLNDYYKSGFDRGHLAAAANHKETHKDLEETFLLSNISPQLPSFNRGYWSKVEKYVRDITKENQAVEVFTGPLYLPYTDTNGKRYVKYEVIGENDVAVPTHFFKVIRIENQKGCYETIAYIFPNQGIAQATPLERFKTTVQQVEKVAGIIFYDHR